MDRLPKIGSNKVKVKQKLHVHATYATIEFTGKYWCFKVDSISQNLRLFGLVILSHIIKKNPMMFA